MVQVLSAKIVQKHPHHAAQWEIKLDLQKIKAKNFQVLVMHTMAFPVMEFQDQGYKIRKVFA